MSHKKSSGFLCLYSFFKNSCSSRHLEKRCHWYYLYQILFHIYLCTGLPSGTGGLVKNSFHLLRQQMSLTEIMNSIHSDASLFLESTEDTGLQEHTDDNCLYCVCIEILGFQPSNQLSAICSHSGKWLCPSLRNLNVLQSQVMSHFCWPSLLIQFLLLQP